MNESQRRQKITPALHEVVDATFPAETDLRSAIHVALAARRAGEMRAPRPSRPARQRYLAFALSLALVILVGWAIYTLGQSRRPLIGVPPITSPTVPVPPTLPIASPTAELSPPPQAAEASGELIQAAANTLAASSYHLEAGRPDGPYPYIFSADIDRPKKTVQGIMTMVGGTVITMVRLGADNYTSMDGKTYLPEDTHLLDLIDTLDSELRAVADAPSGSITVTAGTPSTETITGQATKHVNGISSRGYEYWYTTTAPARVIQIRHGSDTYTFSQFNAPLDIRAPATVRPDAGLATELRTAVTATLAAPRYHFEEVGKWGSQDVRVAADVDGANMKGTRSLDGVVTSFIFTGDVLYLSTNNGAAWITASDPPFLSLQSERRAILGTIAQAESIGGVVVAGGSPATEIIDGLEAKHVVAVFHATAFRSSIDFWYTTGRAPRVLRARFTANDVPAMLTFSKFDEPIEITAPKLALPPEVPTTLPSTLVLPTAVPTALPLTVSPTTAPPSGARGELLQAAANTLAADSYHVEMAISAGGEERAIAADINRTEKTMRGMWAANRMPQQITAVVVGADVYASADGKNYIRVNESNVVLAGEVAGTSDQIDSLIRRVVGAPTDSVNVTPGTPPTTTIAGQATKHVHVVNSTVGGEFDCWYTTTAPARLVQLWERASDTSFRNKATFSRLNMPFNVQAPVTISADVALSNQLESAMIATRTTTRYHLEEVRKSEDGKDLRIAMDVDEVNRAVKGTRTLDGVVTSFIRIGPVLYVSTDNGTTWLLSADQTFPSYDHDSMPTLTEDAIVTVGTPATEMINGLETKHVVFVQSNLWPAIDFWYTTGDSPRVIQARFDSVGGPATLSLSQFDAPIEIRAPKLPTPTP